MRAVGGGGVPPAIVEGMDHTNLMTQPSEAAETPRLVSRQSESLLKVDLLDTAEELTHPFLNGTPRPRLLDWARMILLLPLALVRV